MPNESILVQTYQTIAWCCHYDIAVITILLSFAVWNYTLVVEEKNIHDKVKSQATSLARESEIIFANYSETLTRIAERISFQDRLSREAWTFEAKHFQSSSYGNFVFNWIDRNDVMRWVVPEDIGSVWIDYGFEERPRYKAYLSEVKNAGKTLSSGFFVSERNTSSISLQSPININGEFDGFVGGIFRPSEYFKAVHIPYSMIDIVITSDNTEVYRSTTESIDPSNSFYTRTETFVGNTPLTIEAIPTALFIHENTSLLPPTILSFGVMLSLFVAWVTLQNTVINQSAKTLKRQSMALEQTGDGMIILDNGHNIVDVNQATTVMLGYSREEMLSHNVSEFVVPSKDSQGTSSDRGIALVKSDVWTGEVTARAKDGREILVSITDSSIKDEKGEIVGIISMARDISQQRELEERLRHTERLQSLGQLTGGVAHDFNNVLGVVSATAQCLEIDCEDRHDVLESLKLLQNAVKRGVGLTDQLLSFSRRQSLNPEVIQLKAFISDFARILRRTLGSDVNVHVTLADDVWSVYADENQLSNAILNLAINGRDAMNGVGQLDIEAKNVRFSKVDNIPFKGMDPGTYVAITISDTGSGIAPEALDRIFEPFYTSKGIGKGTGLGLSMVYGFAEQSGGGITVQSETGVGTGFTLYIPGLKTSPQKNEETQSNRMQKPAGHHTVLIVEDQPELGKVTEKIFQRVGCKTILTSSADTAVRLFDQNPEIDLAFLDVILPGAMNGVDLARALRERAPDLKILFTTGYAAQSVMEELGTLEQAGIFNKPLQISDLLETLSVLFGPDEILTNSESTSGKVIPLARRMGPQKI